MTINIDNYLNVLIAGKGKVGSAIGNLIEKTELFEVAYEDPFIQLFVEGYFFPDIIHITFPLYNRDQYVTDVQRILNRFVLNNKGKDPHFGDYPIIVIFDSTIVLDILPQLQEVYGTYCDFVYSPVRGTDKVLEEELLKYQRYYAPVYSKDKHLQKIIDKYYTEIGMEPKFFESSEALILGKLASVGWYTMNIAFTQEIFQICQSKGLDFDQVYTEFNKNETVGHHYDQEKGADYYMERPTFFPGIIGGKCCIQDAVLMLRNQYGN